MSLGRYPEYKESGTGWLGAVPEHWSVLRLKALLDEIDTRASREQLELLGLSKTLGVRRRSDIDQGAAESDDYGKYKTVDVGDIVMNRMQSWNGVFGVSPTKGMTSPDYAVFRVRDEVNARFLCELFRTDIASGEFYRRCRGMGTAFLRLNTGDFFDVKVALPPGDEMASIITFLDHETAKIDSLVAAQGRLIELLQDKRQAVISHAVTKGLIPSASMSESGVGWLGDIPSHWRHAPFAQIIGFQEGPGIMAADFTESGVPLLRVSGVQGRWVTLEGCNYLDPAKVGRLWSHFQLDIGDLVISASASMGTVAEVDGEAVGAVPYTGLIRMKPRDGVMSRDFARFFLSSGAFYTQIELLRTGATIQHFGPTHLRQMKVVVPPMQEQRQIVEFLEARVSDIDALMAHAENAMTLLQERRSALISAAVTGQIDVRGLADQEVA
ncbi:MAG: restriction endonuclease subunit S [Steroidobacteraceae bacterium]